ncbi:MAG TPA: CoA transferase [Mycobacteriales bacterium]|nr:CoA transferase [Mycobacteriales bacterium]
MEPMSFQGLTVLDVSQTFPGALLSGFLADYGADVLLVERPGGSPLRALPAFPFLARGKQSIELDLGTEPGRQTARALARTVDVVVSTFRPRAVRRFGLDADYLTAANPRLVHCSITGFGTVGPLADVPGHEALVMAKLGGQTVFGAMGARPGPAHVSVPYCSFAAAQTGLHGTIAALLERERSGRGQQVEANLAQGLAALDPWNWYSQLIASRYPDAYVAVDPFDDDGSPNSPMVYPLLIALTADGRWLQFSQVQPRLFLALMRALGLEGMFADPYWAGLPNFEDRERRIGLWERMLVAARTKTTAEWKQVFERDPDVWAEIFRHGSELLDHPQLVHDDQVVTVHDPERGPVRQPGPMIRLGGVPAGPVRPAPRLGVHTADWDVRASSTGVGAVVSSQQPAAADGEVSAPPLDGVTILELGSFFAAPYGSTLLTDLGARVVKIEPLAGEPMRLILHFPETGAAKSLQGKESVAVDMTAPEGLRIIHELARRADVVLQCFRAGVAERHRIDAEALRAVNPDLVYVSAPGYGSGGPCGHRPAFAPTIGAGSGMAMRNAGPGIPARVDLTLDDIKRVAPRLLAAGGPVSAQADGVSALGVATAILLGLWRRARGLAPVTVNTSMLATASYALAEDMVDYPGRAPTAMVDSDLLGISALYRMYETASDWVFLAAPSQPEWQRLVATLPGGEALATDPRFVTPQDRRDNDAMLAARLAEVFASREAVAWEQQLLAADVGCVAIASRPVEEVLMSEEIGRAHGYVAETVHPLFDEHVRLAPLVRFSRSATVVRPGCLLGQHTAAVLAEIGYGEAQVQQLADAGVIKLG